MGRIYLLSGNANAVVSSVNYELGEIHNILIGFPHTTRRVAADDADHPQIKSDQNELISSTQLAGGTDPLQFFPSGFRRRGIRAISGL